MVKRMLIDATHPEETRVVVLDGTRLDEFDVETFNKKQNKGNIYLAKVVRVEPSLQAAFVDYGGNRHGFLAFSEIHPDYYQIPVADREKLLAEVRRQQEIDEQDHSDSTADDGAAIDQPAANEMPLDAPTPSIASEPLESTEVAADEPLPTVSNRLDFPDMSALNAADDALRTPASEGAEALDADDQRESPEEIAAANEAYEPAPLDSPPAQPDGDVAGEQQTESNSPAESASDATPSGEEAPGDTAPAEPQPPRPQVDTVGGEDETEDDQGDRSRRRFLAQRHYKIQEVIKRRQIMLVQVVKEERGNKGAALTTYLSLAGRYCVLMPNSARGGGVSRKITNAQDRRRLKSIIASLEMPKSMALILRTAGSERGLPEIRRDYEYMLRAWDQIRELTMKSRAPALIHEEGNLIKRSIRDVYTHDIEEVLVDGEAGYRVAKDFMRMLTPAHARKVVHYGDAQIPLFHRFQVESQLESMNQPMVQLRSGGSIVFGQTEALVAIDVNSGRATRERHIEETALKTNLEAADEIARQLRLRDLAGLIVIDFIDMEDNRNNHAVERRLKDALKSDRARIQVGRISHFGLLELSRQRMRPSLIETNYKICPHCGGTGHIRATESSAIFALRAIEEEGARRRSSEATVTVHPDVTSYLLNYKRDAIVALETRYGMRVFVVGDAELVPPAFRLDRVKASRSFGDEAAPGLSAPPPDVAPVDAYEDPPLEDAAEHSSAESPTESEAEGRSDQGGDRDELGGRKRRRRRRGRGRNERMGGAEGEQSAAASFAAAGDRDVETDPAEPLTEDSTPSSSGQEQTSVDDQGRDEQGRRRRRGRRGGRRRREFGDQPRDRGSMASPQPDLPSDGSDPGTWSPAPAEDAHRPLDGVSGDSTSTQPSSGSERANGASRLFRAIKQSLPWGRADSKRNDAVGETPVAVSEPVRAEESVVSLPSPPPPPLAPAPVVVAPEPPMTGPPKRGWWQEPKG